MRILDASGVFYDSAAMRSRMVCSSHNIGFNAFLAKFAILNEVQWTPWAIELAVAQVCEDLAVEGIQHSIISFTIDKYINDQFGPIDAIKFISSAFNEHAGGVHIDLMLSLAYHSPRAFQLECAGLIDKGVDGLLCGLDLVGDEKYFDADFYRPIFKKWHDHKKILRAHVGEMPGTACNIQAAIRDLGADRIAHGIQADRAAMLMAVDNGTYFDLALHSNLVTGAWHNLHSHPIRDMVDIGCAVTLNTDDPVQFMCTLDDEFQLAIDSELITMTQADQIMCNSCAGVLRPTALKEAHELIGIVERQN